MPLFFHTFHSLAPKKETFLEYFLDKNFTEAGIVKKTKKTTFVLCTNKETDESWDIYNMKNQFWAGLGSRAVLVKKKFGADPSGMYIE